MAKIAFFTTSGKKISFAVPVAYSPVFTTGKLKTSFFATTEPLTLFKTSGVAESFFVTNNPVYNFLSSGRRVAFLVTPDPNTPKLLVLQLGAFSVNEDQTIIYVSDDTGTYNPDDPTLDPGGYNPESADFNPYRPYRAAVNLWTVYKLRSRSDASGFGNNTITPNTQPNQDDNPYIYDLTLPTELNANKMSEVIQGLYEIFLIAAPDSENYVDYVGRDLVSIASSTPDWYITKASIMIDAAVSTCLAKKRWNYLQAVMCGKCDDDYMSIYAIYVGLVNAMAAGEWDRAKEYYSRLKTICSEVDAASCGC
jgi:hypothetical protein